MVGGMMVIELLAGTMGLDRGRIAAVGCSSMGAGSIGGKKYCGNLLWQSSLTLLPPWLYPPRRTQEGWSLGDCGEVIGRVEGHRDGSRNHLRRGYGGQEERKGRKDLNHGIHEIHGKCLARLSRSLGVVRSNREPPTSGGYV